MASNIEPQPNWAVKSHDKNTPPVEPRAKKARLVDYYLWKWKPRLRLTLFAWLRRLFKVMVSPLPKMAKLALSQSLQMTMPVDYAKNDVLLSIQSWIEYDKRTRSCGKEPETVFWLENFVKPGDVVYDIGANVGAYSLVLAKHLNGRCKIYAFEPSFANFSQLCRNVFINDVSQSVHPMFVALSEHTGMETFHYSDVTSGAALHALGNVDGRFNSRFEQPMICYRMDDLVSELAVQSPNHIKLDVDGIEYAILKGAKQTLCNPSLKSIIVETEENREGEDIIAEELQKYGFRIDSVHVHNQNPFHPGPYVRNIIFVRDMISTVSV